MQHAVFAGTLDQRNLGVASREPAGAEGGVIPTAGALPGDWLLPGQPAKTFGPPRMKSDRPA